MLRPVPPLRDYIHATLGTRGWDFVWLMFRDSLGAKNPESFWQNWNPVTGWFLRFYVYRPLRSRFPRPVAAVLAFLVSGFLFHDLPFGWGVYVWYTGHLAPPFATLWFAFIGLSVLATKNVDWSLHSWVVRASLNAAVISLSAVLAMATWALLLFGWR